jgi:hypothetical protein
MVRVQLLSFGISGNETSILAAVVSSLIIYRAG